MDGFKDANENLQEADWDMLYENYSVAVDVRTWLWYKDLIKTYPNVKVILTIRDPESWYNSMKNFISIKRDPKNRVDWGRPLQISNLLNSFSQNPDSPLYRSLKDKESGMTDFVPKESLLVMELGEGWERLCEFLDKPIPDIPYPNLSNPKELQENVTKRIHNFKNSVKSLDVGETK